MWERIKHSLPVHVLLFTLAGIAVTGAVSMVRSALAVREEEAAARRRIADLAAQKVGLEERLN
ncbi:MAG: hypothetical protein HY221_01690, partial [Candidatus Sungbacteria bacterium]|nr:hypothetical protein [Candidatus Sungbacteria bacterium]